MRIAHIQALILTDPTSALVLPTECHNLGFTLNFTRNKTEAINYADPRSKKIRKVCMRLRGTILMPPPSRALAPHASLRIVASYQHLSKSITLATNMRHEVRHRASGPSGPQRDP